MNYNSLKGYVLTILSGIVLIAAVLLIVLQWGNTADFSAYGKNVKVNTALLVICSAVGGIVLVALFWVLFRGVRDLRQGRKDQQLHDTERRLKQADKAEKADKA